MTQKEKQDQKEQMELAMIESYSSSGSGWEYGATVTLVCKETGAEATVTSW